MKGIGEKIGESPLVQKTLRSLPDKFNPKVSAIEEMNDLKTLSIDQLLGTLIAYEMRISTYKYIIRESYFKVDKNIDSEIEQVEAKFVRILKTGSGKYKEKLPFKCFNCGKVGTFASKFPYKEKYQNFVDEEKHTFKRYNKNNNYKKKSLCANDVDPSEVMNSESSCEDKLNNFMLMAIEYLEDEYTGSDMNDEDVVVDMEGELIRALEEIDRIRVKKRKQNNC